MPRVVATTQFAKCLRELLKKGREGKAAIEKSRAAMAEAATDGKISLRRTNHGETRFPNAEKYELVARYRLVVQLLDPAQKHRAFLFAGDHDDADAWLERHKDYKWVHRKGDDTIEFTKISFPGAVPNVVPDIDAETPESLLTLPLLRDVSEAEWKASHAPSTVVDYLKSVSGELWESDPNGIADHVQALADMDWAIFALDVLDLAHKREWRELHRRFEVVAGTSTVVEGAQAAAAMVLPANSETFVTWEDVDSLPEDLSWADFLLFLHQEQKLLATRDFNGPARIRGVSGSGKTTVMVHRARHLAKTYGQPILLVTLTESARRLLELLVRYLCGAEQSNIRTTTLNRLATDVIDSLAPGGLSSYLQANDKQLDFACAQSLEAVRHHNGFPQSVLARIPATKLDEFIMDEVEYIRMRLLPDEYEKYMKLPRYGRGIPLPEPARVIMLEGVNAFDAALKRYGSKDPHGVVQYAVSLLSGSSANARNTFRYRCVLVDEVQDLSQLEMRLLSLIPDNDGKRASDLPNGMFLVGDGAQTIYRKGFALKPCGISISGRSFALKKNYRNTREILQAAYGLIDEYEFADDDEENIQPPLSPDLSSRHGEKPIIVKCSRYSDQVDFVVSRITEMLRERDARDEAAGNTEPTELPICIIGFTRGDRERFGEALRRAKVRTAELWQDVAWDSAAVKISTLESAKGHEFHTVFIVGMIEGTMPNARVERDDWKREASRLYVAMTRARDRLYLSYDVGGKYGPSPFLALIQDDCTECEWRGGSLV
jgi:superfamily I DNA/RNA helicase